MKCSLVPAITAAFLTITPAYAQSFAFVDSSGDNQISILPGASFSFRLDLGTTTNTGGVTFFLETSGSSPAKGSGLFRITARDTSMMPYRDVTAGTLSLTDALLSPRVGKDLGGTLDFAVQTSVSPGVYPLSIFTIAADPSIAPGDYIIQTSTNSQFFSDDFGTSTSVPQAVYLVKVLNPVPEPGGAVLFFLGLFTCAAMTRNRARRRWSPRAI